MTTADALRALANEVERREQLEAEVAELRKQLLEAAKRVATNQPEWLTVAEAAEYIGRDKGFLDKDRMPGKPPRISYVQPDGYGTKVLYARSELDRFLSKGQRRAA